MRTLALIVCSSLALMACKTEEKVETPDSKPKGDEIITLAHGGRVQSGLYDVYLGDVTLKKSDYTSDKVSFPAFVRRAPATDVVETRTYSEDVPTNYASAAAKSGGIANCLLLDKKGVLLGGVTFTLNRFNSGVIPMSVSRPAPGRLFCEIPKL